MNNRIKQIRKAINLTQSAFGERLGVKGNTVTGWESGIREPSSVVIASICREFNVSENWLRTGEGEMFKPVNRDEAIATFVGEALRGESDDFRRRLLSVLARLTVDEWELLERMVRQLAEGCKKGDQE